MKRNRKGLYEYGGYLGFRVMCALHQELFPGEKVIAGNSRKGRAILRAFDKVYTDGIEDTAQLMPEELTRVRRRIFPPKDRDRDV